MIEMADRPENNEKIDIYLDILRTVSNENKINELIKQKLSALLVSSFDSEKMRRNYDSPNQWVGAFLTQSYGRNIIAELKRSNENDYFLNFCAHKIAELGFTEENYHLDIPLAKVRSPRIFQNYVRSFLKRFLKSRSAQNSLISALKRYPPRVEKFISCATFQPFLFALAQREILLLYNRTGNPGADRALKALSIKLTLGCPNVPKSECARLIFPNYFATLAPAEARTLADFIDSNGRTDLNAAAALLKSAAAFPRAVFWAAGITASLLKSLFPPKAGGETSAVFVLAAIAVANERYGRSEAAGKARGAGGADGLNLVAAEETPNAKTEAGRTVEAFSRLGRVYDGKGFGANAKKHCAEVRALIDIPIISHSIATIIDSLLTDKEYYNTSHHSLSTPVFFHLLYLMAKKQPEIRENVFETAAAVYKMEFPPTFGAIRAISLRRKAVKVLLCLVQNSFFGSVFDFMRKHAEKMDFSLIRYFIATLLGSVAPPFSSGFLETVVDFIFGENYITEIVASDPDCDAAVRNFVLEITKDKRDAEKIKPRLVEKMIKFC